MEKLNDVWTFVVHSTIMFWSPFCSGFFNVFYVKGQDSQYTEHFIVNNATGYSTSCCVLLTSASGRQTTLLDARRNGQTTSPTISLCQVNTSRIFCAMRCVLCGTPNYTQPSPPKSFLFITMNGNATSERVG